MQFLSELVLYEKDSISLDNISNALKYKELKKSFSDCGIEGKGLMRKRRKQQENFNRKKSNAISMSIARKQNVYEGGKKGSLQERLY